MEASVIPMSIMIELQKEFSNQQRHLESYNCLLQYLVKKLHLGNPNLVVEATKDLSAMLNTVKIFNTAASLVNFTIKFSSQEDTQEVTQEDVTRNPTPLESADSVKDRVEDQITLFNLNRVELAIGDTGKCIMATVIDKSMGLAYITVGTDENSKIFSNLKENCLKNGKYQWIPPSNTIFGFHDEQDDLFFRAICVNNSRKFCGSTIDIFLVDFGQYTKMDATDPFYMLSGDFKYFPAQARLVKIAKINGQPYDSSLIELVKQGRCSYLVTYATENATGVELSAELQDSDVSIEENLSIDVMNHIFEPPLDFEPDKVISPAPSSFGEASGYDFSDYPRLCNGKNRFNNPRTDKDDNVNADCDDFSDIDENLGETNALRAVMGFLPKDDRDYCKFFDEKTLGCFKGPHCHKIHLPLDEDGWTQDTQPVKISIAKAPLPEVDSEITGIVTNVVNPEVCYIHLDVNNVERLFLVNDEIDYLVKAEQLDVIKHNLQKWDLVTAYFDGHWYRAQVVDSPMKHSYHVRYVDYGITKEVTKKWLRQWCSQFDHVPFFAHRVRIANVQTIKTEIIKATKFLQRTLMEGSVSNLQKIVMKIISNDPEIRLTMLDCDGFDIGEQMVALGLVNYRSI